MVQVRWNLMIDPNMLVGGKMVKGTERVSSTHL